MKQISLDGAWKIRWCDGQRGGMPHYVRIPEQPNHVNIFGLKHEIKNHYDPVKWIDAVVPGEVHLDLWREGIIPSPYKELGVLSSRWVEECIWFYRRLFDAGELTGEKLIKLVFEGLDYAAIIYLNGKEIGRHENAFYPCELDISGLLKPEGNELIVQIESGLFTVSEKPIKDYYTATMTMDVLLHKRNWLRKIQSQTEWDWSPRLLNVGLFLPVSIKADSSLVIDSMAITPSLNDSLDRGTVRVRLFSTLYDKNIRNIVMKIEVDGKTNEYSFERVPENGVFEAEFPVDAPKLWWPAGYGIPNLYTVNASLWVNSKEVYSQSKKTGFRKVSVNQDPHPEKGTYFIFEINRQPVFMKGANLVPNDIITAQFSKNRYQRLVELALEANFNFLRVWGGGLYETEEFYDLCNEKGIMVWQEFIAACAVIPAQDEDLRENIRKEAIYNIRRLSRNPSLIAWCGNNEIGWGCVGNTDFHSGEDNVLYEEMYPALLREEDPAKYYQPTSPFSKTGNDYNEDSTGDQHPWSVGFENKDSRNYEKFACRFPNEGGILGPVSLKTMKECLREGEGIHSFSWQIHDNMEENWIPGSSPDEDVKFWMDRDPRQMSLEEYVYAGGFVQAEGLKRYIDNFRRRKYNSSGAVFWMYNDCWPAVRSWTIVDYNLYKTPSYHPVRRAFSPVAPVIAIENGACSLYGVNDTLDAWEGEVHYGLFTASGRYLEENRLAVTLKQNASTVLAVIHPAESTNSVLLNGSAETVFAFACLYDKHGELVARTRYSSLRYFEMTLPEPKIHIECTKTGYRLKSDSFVLGVCLGLDGDEPLSDNFFDLYPGQPYEVDSAIIKEKPVLFHLNQFLDSNRNDANRNL